MLSRKNAGAKCCHRCGTAGKKSRDDAETLFCPKCGIWLEEEEEIPTEPSNAAPTEPAPRLDDWAEALKAMPPKEPTKPPRTWDVIWAQALKDFPAT